MSSRRLTNLTFAGAKCQPRCSRRYNGITHNHIYFNMRTIEVRQKRRRRGWAYVYNNNNNATAADDPPAAVWVVVDEFLNDLCPRDFI